MAFSGKLFDTDGKVMAGIQGGTSASVDAGETAHIKLLTGQSGATVGAVFGAGSAGRIDVIEINKFTCS